MIPFNPYHMDFVSKTQSEHKQCCHNIKLNI